MSATGSRKFIAPDVNNKKAKEMPQGPPTKSKFTTRFNQNVTAQYKPATLIGNWVEDRFECPKQGTLYIAPKEEIDYEKMKPESRQDNFRQNKLSGTQGTGVHAVLRHDSHDTCGNFATTTDLVYQHLPKPLCGPELRHYKKSAHQYYPQPDLMRCFGNVTEWGLKQYKEYEWACTDVSDYCSSLYEDSFRAPRCDEYLQRHERKARNSSFTKTFLFKMTKSKS